MQKFSTHHMTALLVPRTFQFATDSVEGPACLKTDKLDFLEMHLHLLCEVNLKNFVNQQQLY